MFTDHAATMSRRTGRAAGGGATAPRRTAAVRCLLDPAVEPQEGASPGAVSQLGDPDPRGADLAVQPPAKPAGEDRTEVPGCPVSGRRRLQPTAALGGRERRGELDRTWPERARPPPDRNLLAHGSIVGRDSNEPVHLISPGDLSGVLPYRHGRASRCSSQACCKTSRVSSKPGPMRLPGVNVAGRCFIPWMTPIVS